MALNEKDSEVKKKPHEMSNAELVSKLMGKKNSILTDMNFDLKCIIHKIFI